ncbi:MAG: tetratricopeptide repeat protein [Candidatus Obscuribacterales bacterium]|nr:tetratricopeptide repeat protein [Candidatus Obscuribacterales bacterium]
MARRILGSLKVSEIMLPHTRAHKSISPEAPVLTVLAAFSFGLLAEAEAADFSHSQKVYVPPTSYDRRIDFSSIREQYTAPKNSATAKAASSSKTASTSTKAAGSKTATAVSKSKTSLAAGKAPVKTIVNTTPPPPALNGKLASGQSFSEIARSLSSKVPPATIAKMKQSAIDLQKSGKLEEAHRVLAKISQLKPEDKAAYQQLASVGVQRAKNYLQSNNLPEALQAARQALAVSPNDPEAHKILAQLYSKAGADPNDVNSRLKTAQALYGQARYQEAEVEYKASLAVKPTPEAHVGLGKIAEHSKAGSGKAHFEQALELDSNSALAHRELGMQHLANSDLVAANSHLSRALIINPADKEAGQSLVKLWQSQVSRLPNANSHLGLARAYQLNGDLQSAQAEYREVVRLDPSHPYLPAARQSFKIALAKQEADKSLSAAKTLEQQGLLSEAFQKSSEAVSYSPGNSAYKLYQAQLLEKMGQPAQAKQVYLNVLKDDPQNTAAVSKIKELAQVAAGGLNTAGLLPGGTGIINRHPAGFPGTKFPGSMLSDSAATVMAAGSPALQAMPAAAGTVPQIDQVGQLSNFMGQIRNHMLVQKEADQKFEDTAHKIIKQLTNPDPEPQASPAPVVTASASDDDIIKKILSSPSPSSSASAGNAESGAADALAGAAAALAAAKGAGSAPSASATSTPALLAKAAPALSSKSPQKIASKSSSRLQELEKQNKALQEQLKKLSSSNTSAAIPSTAPPLASGSNAFPQAAPGFSSYSNQANPLQLSNQLPPVSAFNPAQAIVPNTADAMAQFNALPQQAAPSAAFNPSQAIVPNTADALSQFSSMPAIASAGSTMPSLMPQAQGAPSAQHELRGPILNSQALKFELRQIKPTLRDVQLKVVLRNDGDSPVALPDGLQAVIKYNNQTESPMKIAFAGKSVAAHSAVDGVVKVPFDKVDPTADLVLRNLPSAAGDLHIIKNTVSPQ